MTTRILTAVLVALIATSSARADNRDFNLINNTPWQIDSVYVVQPDQKGWGNDILGQTTMSAATSRKVIWPSDGLSLECFYDVKVTFHAQPPIEIYWNNVNVCSITQMKVWYDFDKRRYEASWD